MATKKGHAYQFKYEGNFKSLDAVTVLHSQLSFITILKEIKDHQFPEIKMDIRIKGLEKGSLDIHHVLEVSGVMGMFVMENYEYISSVFKILGDLIKLKKFLKSEKAEQITKVDKDKVEIHIHGKNITVHPDAIKIYQKSPVISNAFNNTGQLLHDNPEIDYVELSDERTNRKLLKINKAEFNLFKEPNPYLLGKIDEQTYKKNILFIKKPNLFPDKKRKWVWEFLHQGRDIKGVIKDDSFMKKINEGLRLGQGDRLQADLKIFYRFDERLTAFIESGKYEVTNICKVIKRTEESKFDF